MTRASIDLKYRGPAKVEVIPPGVSGEEVVMARAKLKRGSIWRRGRQRVRLLKVITAKRRRLGQPVVKVEFQELSYGSSVRKMGIGAFLRSSWPILVAAGLDSVGQP